MSRHSDVHIVPSHGHLPPLPIIDWKRIGKKAPTVLSVNYQGPDKPLPQADVVIITWTVAEWAALDHVFINSGSTRSKYDKEWRKEWHLYSRQAPKSTFSQLWGYFRMVSIEKSDGKPLNVLLFKSGSHLAHPPWIDGLTEMIQCIVQDTQPQCVYSIGTAGGSTLEESLGDAVITTSAHIVLKKSENTHVNYNNQTFQCPNYFPATDLIESTQTQLFFKMSNAVTHGELEYLFYLLQKATPDADVNIEDLVNRPLDPSALHHPKAIPSQKPLLTTDYYFIATGDDASQYCFLEMDDAVIAHEAGQLGVDYAFIRNISDPLVAEQTQAGKTIPNKVRDEWSSLIYENFGEYTSVNSALLAWATLAGK